MNSIISICQFSNAKIYWAIRHENHRLGKSKVGGRSKELEKKINNLIQQDKIELIPNFSLHTISITKKKLNLTPIKGKILSGIDLIIQNTGNNADYSFLNKIPLDLDKNLMLQKN